MSYFKSVLDNFYYIINTINIPIPLTTEKIVYVSLFHIIFVLFIFGVIIWFFKEFLGFGAYVSRGIASREINTDVHNAIHKNDKVSNKR